ncbi:hypothetical protein AJ85_15370 [Alkalihalobacillus alcalophilus ATCC 27647 = CGMCC 1.3604]|uniref:Uncharacterized protein n=1 Tax=Alkalihalobacillus alcalophilus ATCC 27647 = CGMCC 1.3604 TaxID=1218173 RepID=A0A4S4JX15_ALKAL|nr:hypothetical protein AJ85_15370 [Alkalihalobacillus alcalophilus ATCC 27647 = CGMCC 1.3604]
MLIKQKKYLVKMIIRPEKKSNVSILNKVMSLCLARGARRGEGADGLNA